MNVSDEIGIAAGQVNNNNDVDDSKVDDSNDNDVETASVTNHDTSHSLDWDHLSMTVNLSDPFSANRLFSIPSDEIASDDSLDEVFIPDLSVPESPPSPY